MSTSHSGLPLSVDSRAFTQALALAANGVTVVTTDGDGGKAGLTVSSMCSVCAEPPVLLVCVNQENEFCHAVATNQHFGVNLLTTAQTDIAGIFAGLAGDPDRDRFLKGRWQTLKTGSPILQDALVALDCELSTFYPHGTHNIYIGRVVDTHTIDGDALVYCKRDFGQVAPLRS